MPAEVLSNPLILCCECDLLKAGSRNVSKVPKPNAKNAESYLNNKQERIGEVHLHISLCETPKAARLIVLNQREKIQRQIAEREPATEMYTSLCITLLCICPARENFYALSSLVF